MGGGIPLPRWGPFLEIWVLKTSFWVRYKLKININLARNVYDCSTMGGGGGGEPFLLSNVLDTNGEGVGLFLEIWVLNTGFLCALLSLN